MILTLTALVGRSLARVRGALLGVAGLLSALQVAIVLQAASHDQPTFETLGRLTPEFIQRWLGDNIVAFASFGGLVAFGYFHPVVLLLVAMVAAFVASEPAADVEGGQVDLLLSRPVARHWLVTRSAVLSLVSPLMLAALMIASTSVAVAAFSPPSARGPSAVTLVTLAAHLVGVAWCWRTVARARRGRTAARGRFRPGRDSRRRTVLRQPARRVLEAGTRRRRVLAVSLLSRDRNRGRFIESGRRSVPPWLRRRHSHRAVALAFPHERSLIVPVLLIAVASVGSLIARFAHRRAWRTAAGRRVPTSRSPGRSSSSASSTSRRHRSSSHAFPVRRAWFASGGIAMSLGGALNVLQRLYVRRAPGVARVSRRKPGHDGAGRDVRHACRCACRTRAQFLMLLGLLLATTALSVRWGHRNNAESLGTD